MNYKAFHKFSYGLYIIASEYNGIKCGYIGNTAFQVTSEPAQIAISCHKKNYSAGIIQNSGIFSISVLKKEVDTSLIGTFGFMSGNDFDKFRNSKTITSVTGAPIVIDYTLAWFDCRVVNTIDVGSHILFIGEVAESDILSGEEPLTYDYYREKYKMLSSKNAPTYIEPSKIEDLAVADTSGKVPDKESSEEKDMEPYICTICGFHYNPDEGDQSLGITAGTSFDDLPDDYRCPLCNAGKEYFRKA